MKLGDGKGSNNGNEIYKLKELRKQNSKFKKKIKALNKKVTQGEENYEGNNRK